MSKLELLKTAYKRLGFSDRPVLGWTIIGLSGVILVNIWAGDWWDGIKSAKGWIKENIAICSIFILAACIGFGSYRNLWKAIKDQQKEIETLRKEAKD